MTFHSNRRLPAAGAAVAPAGESNLRRPDAWAGAAAAPRALPHAPGRSGSLDPRVRSLMESRFGRALGHVRVHTGGRAAEAADALHAQAYTVGSDVVFGAGEYRPRTPAGGRLLAHELTHVLQQTATTGPTVPAARAEDEADASSRKVEAGLAVPALSAAPWGTVQRQEKPKTKVSGDRTGTKEGRDKFGFKAEVSVPLSPDLTSKFKFGKVGFLDQLKLTGAGGVTGEPLGMGGAELEDLKLQAAMTLARLELARAKDKAEALSTGQLSFGTTLTASAGPTLSFDPFDAKGSLGAALTTKVSATTPSLLPAGGGELTAGTSVTGTGSVAQDLGSAGKATPKVEGKVGSDVTFKSPPSSALGLGGVLGSTGSVTAGVETGASLSATPDKTSGKLSGGASVGLTGSHRGVERFIRLEITGEIGIDRKAGSATTTSRSVFIGATTGFSF